MKYMLIMRAVDQAKVEQYQQRPFEEIIAEMGAYNEAMINAGVLENPHVDAATAIHLMPFDYRLGEIATRPGTGFSSIDDIDIATRLTPDRTSLTAPTSGAEALARLSI